MGYITATKGSKTITASIYVWANAASDIDLIFNGVETELTKFIQED